MILGMYRMLVIAASSVLAIRGATPGWSQGFVPSGQCAVVVASRPTVQAAVQYIYEYGRQSAARVFESSNGWFAITSGMIRDDGSTAVNSRMKSSGSIPNDAFCSTAVSDLREVNWRAAVQDSDQPMSTGLWSEFDARPLSLTEKRFLQAALAMEGYYNGLLDGIWGNGSQSALERYTAAEFEGMKPANAMRPT